MTGEEYDALRAEAEALRAEIEELDALCNRQSDLLSQAAIALRGPEPALTRYNHADIPLRVKMVVSELEAARGLLEQRIPCDVMLPPATTIKRGCPLSTVLASMKLREDVAPNQRVFTATPAPEVQGHLRDSEKMFEQGERQEAVAHRLINGIGEVMTDWHDGPPPENFVDLCGQAMKDVRVELAFSTPQPGPDVRGMASFALELIDGALEGGSFDGGDIQEAGVRHGLLVVERREESCGEHCSCAEYGFPAECYRLTPALAAHRQAQRQS